MRLLLSYDGHLAACYDQEYSLRAVISKYSLRVTTTTRHSGSWSIISFESKARMRDLPKPVGMSTTVFFSKRIPTKARNWTTSSCQAKGFFPRSLEYYALTSVTSST